MNEPLVVLGAALVVGAIVGGSLKIANFAELPSIIDSIPRQLLLGCFGAVVMGIGLIGLVDGGSESGGPVNAGDVEPARIELSKDKGRPGTKLTVSGVGFAPNELVELHAQARELRDDIRADAKGRFSDERVTIPPDSDPFFNPYKIRAVGRSSGDFDSADFEVTGESKSRLDGPGTRVDVEPARIELSKDKGRPGTKLTVSGVGFAPNELVELHAQARELRDDIRADAKGRFSDERVTIPPDSDPFFNPYKIRAVGRSSGDFDSADFEVTGESKSELDEFEPPFDELQP